MKPETLDKICTLISRATDDEIREMLDAMNARRQLLWRAKEREALNSIRVGDTVRVISGKPRYLIGTRATVIDRQNTRFRIRLLDPVDPRALRRFGREPLCPATMIRKVET